MCTTMTNYETAKPRSLRKEREEKGLGITNIRMRGTLMALSFLTTENAKEAQRTRRKND